MAYRSQEVLSNEEFVPNDQVENGVRHETDISSEFLAEMEKKAATYNNMEFEPGVHIGSAEQLADLAKVFESNWYAASAWNPEVLQRLKAYKPKFLAIDGMTAQTPFPPSEYVVKQSIRISSPGMPNKINGTSKVNLVAADCIVSNTRDESAVSLYFSDAIRNFNHEAFEQGADLAVLQTIVGLAMAVESSRALLKSEGNSQNLPANSSHISRRNFLKFAGVAGALAVAEAAGLTKLYMSYAEAATKLTDEEKDQFVSFWGSIPDHLFHNTLTDGRTALLLQKNRENLAYLDEDPNVQTSTVLGASHSRNAALYMQSPEAREEAIIHMLEDMKVLSESLETEFNLPPDVLFPDFLVSVLRIQNYEFRDPSLYKPDADPQDVKNAITLTGDFVSPMVARVVREQFPQYATVVENTARQIEHSISVSSS